jgi:hypothetical protein
MLQSNAHYLNVNIGKKTEGVFFKRFLHNNSDVAQPQGPYHSLETTMISPANSSIHFEKLIKSKCSENSRRF